MEVFARIVVPSSDARTLPWRKRSVAEAGSDQRSVDVGIPGRIRARPCEGDREPRILRDREGAARQIGTVDAGNRQHQRIANRDASGRPGRQRPTVEPRHGRGVSPWRNSGAQEAPGFAP